MSGVKMMFGPDTVRESVKIQNIEDQKETVSALVAMGMDIGKRVENSREK